MATLCHDAEAGELKATAALTVFIESGTKTCSLDCAWIVTTDQLGRRLVAHSPFCSLNAQVRAISIRRSNARVTDHGVRSIRTHINEAVIKTRTVIREELRDDIESRRPDELRPLSDNGHRSYDHESVEHLSVSLQPHADQRDPTGCRPGWGKTPQFVGNASQPSIPGRRLAPPTSPQGLIAAG